MTLGTAIAGTYTFTNNSVTAAQTLTFAGNISGGTGGTAAAKTLIITGAGNTVVSGIIGNGGGGALALTKTGNGTLTLTNTNSFTGQTTITTGTLVLAGGNGTTTSTTNGNTTAGSISIGGSGTLQLQAITGAGGNTVSGVSTALNKASGHWG